MNWVIPSLIVVAAMHVIAIMVGRPAGSLQHRIAFVSGILGLISIPVIILAGLTSICIAGACGDGVGSVDLAAIVFAIAALVSLISLVVIGVRGPRA